MTTTVRALPLFLSLLLIPLSAEAVTIDWVTVGNPGNANDTIDGDQLTDGVQNFGAVDYPYRIGKYEVTNTQYVDFLNAKDPTGSNVYGLYDPAMTLHGRIDRNLGNPNGDKYSVIVGAANQPVNWITWYDAIRFANWVNNGQGSGDTETGAYTLGPSSSGLPVNSASITRNAGANVFLPSENEWYKAAYYNPGTNSYFQYPTSSNTAPIASGPSAVPNHANYSLAANGTTDVGAYTGTTSPYGALDMAGNIAELTEAATSDADRIDRGGLYGSDVLALLSSRRHADDPGTALGGAGFRLATVVPEPSTFALFGIGVGAFWLLFRLRSRGPASQDA